MPGLRRTREEAAGEERAERQRSGLRQHLRSAANDGRGRGQEEIRDGPADRQAHEHLDELGRGGDDGARREREEHRERREERGPRSERAAHAEPGDEARGQEELREEDDRLGHELKRRNPLSSRPYRAFGWPNA
jgi:hypothetical protein